MNLVEATVANGFVEIAGWRIPLDEKRRPAREGRAIVGIRPEDFEDAAFAESGAPEDRGRGRRSSRSSAPRRT